MNPEALGWDDRQLLSAIESVLLAAAGPVSLAELAHLLGVPRARVGSAVARLSSELTRGIRLQVQSGEAQLATAPENSEVVRRFLGTTRLPALPRAAMETLSVIAYNQPVTRPEIEQARGVNSDRAVESLLQRGLIEERGQRATIGRPIEYGTTLAFLEYFGLLSLDQLPPLPSEEPPQAGAGIIGMRQPRSQRRS